MSCKGIKVYIRMALFSDDTSGRPIITDLSYTTKTRHVTTLMYHIWETLMCYAFLHNICVTDLYKPQ